MDKSKNEKLKSLSECYADGTWTFDGTDEYAIYSIPRGKVDELIEQVKDNLNGTHFEVWKSDFVKGSKDLYFKCAEQQ